MIKNILIACSLIFLISCGSSKTNETTTTDTTTKASVKPSDIKQRNIEVISVKGTALPESIKYKNGKLYIANLGDANAPKDGFILVANADGSNPQKLFEGELDSPKGFSFLTDDIIIIPDQVNDSSLLGNIVLASIKDNKVIAKLEVPNSKFLNDTVVINPTTVAVTDTGANSVYFINVKNNSELSLANTATGIVGANGIALIDGILYVAGSTFGGDANGGNVYTLNTDGSGVTIWKDRKLGAGALDGIAVYNGLLYVSDWGQDLANGNASVWAYDMNTKNVVDKISGDLSGAADIDLVNGVIYVPELTTGKIRKIDLTK